MNRTHLGHWPTSKNIFSVDKDFVKLLEPFWYFRWVPVYSNTPASQSLRGQFFKLRKIVTQIEHVLTCWSVAQLGSIDMEIKGNKSCCTAWIRIVYNEFGSEYNMNTIRIRHVERCVKYGVLIFVLNAYLACKQKS